MPRIDKSIARAWWHNDKNQISYVIVDDETGEERRLLAERQRDPGLWRVLHDALTARGYDGPATQEQRRITTIQPL